MKKYFLMSIFGCAVLAPARPVPAQPAEFSFGVIAQSHKAADETDLRAAIAETDKDNLAFVVANGIKSGAEPCSDDIYLRRMALLNEAKNGLILSLAASDWAACRQKNGKSAAMDRLNRTRDLFFADEFSFGASRIPLVRQSATPKFRNNGENARWEFGDVLFATINLPANNNHYLSDAGRNSEFEDRMIANQDWLQKIFKFATRKKLNGIVLFCDGNPLLAPSAASLRGRRDGFHEIREKLTALAAKFPGMVLIVHGQIEPKPSVSAAIHWRGNLGDLEAGSSWTKLTVNPSAPTLFAINDHPEVAKNTHQ
jgi:hypothetical protein